MIDIFVSVNNDDTFKKAKSPPFDSCDIRGTIFLCLFSGVISFIYITMWNYEESEINQDILNIVLIVCDVLPVTTT